MLTYEEYFAVRFNEIDSGTKKLQRKITLVKNLEILLEKESQGVAL